MNPLPNHLYSDFFNALAVAHGIGSRDRGAPFDGFAFTPDGARFHLRPHGVDHSLALLEIDIIDLDDVPNAHQPSALDRVLRTLLQLNDTLLNDHDWLISLREDDMLILSNTVSLSGLTVDALQLLALQGLQRAQAIRQLCGGVSLPRREFIPLESPLLGQLA